MSNQDTWWLNRDPWFIILYLILVPQHQLHSSVLFFHIGITFKLHIPHVSGRMLLLDRFEHQTIGINQPTNQVHIQWQRSQSSCVFWAVLFPTCGLCTTSFLWVTKRCTSWRDRYNSDLNDLNAGRYADRISIRSAMMCNVGDSQKRGGT